VGTLHRNRKILLPAGRAAGRVFPILRSPLTISEFSRDEEAIYIDIEFFLSGGQSDVT
jgi:hypothetical protein